MLWQSIFAGFTEGWIYVLVALGLALCFSIMRILQFAHGEIYMLGAYVAFYLISGAHVNFFAALVISGLALGVLGIILERIMFRRLRGNMEPALLAAIGLTLIFQTLGAILFTSYTKYILVPNMLSGVLVLWGVRLPWIRLVIAIIGLVLVLILILVINKTKIGHAMVAISQNAEAASLQGIDVNPISAVTLGISCFMAAIAGTLMGSVLPMSPFMGTFAITKAIGVIILAGIGSIPGVIAGGLILGLVDGVVPLYTDPTIATIISFSIIILILLFKPEGLFGHE
jgi:branched-chain amino acid transport system permease protein